MKISVNGKPLKKCSSNAKTIGELLKEIGISRENAIVIMDGKIVTEFESINRNAYIEIISVSSEG